jgi:hypothetical protein
VARFTKESAGNECEQVVAQVTRPHGALAVEQSRLGLAGQQGFGELHIEIQRETARSQRSRKGARDVCLTKHAPFVAVSSEEKAHVYDIGIYHSLRWKVNGERR